MSFQVFQAQGLRIFAGDTATCANYTGNAGEISVNTETKAVYVHDGLTPGGTPLTTAEQAELLGMTLGQLANVELDTPSDGQVLVYDEDAGVWKNEMVAGAGGGAVDLDGLNDVDLVNPADNQVLTYNQGLSKWENKEAPAAGVDGIANVDGNIEIGDQTGYTIVKGDLRVTDESYTRIELYNQSDVLNPNNFWLIENNNSGYFKILRRKSESSSWQRGLEISDTGKTKVGNLQTGPVWSIDSELSNKSRWHKNDYWLNGEYFYPVGNLGQLESNGSYHTSITSNGYRNTSNKWTSYGQNGKAGAAQVSCSPVGEIYFRCHNNWPSGSSSGIPVRATVKTDGKIYATGFSSSSDERLKTDISVVENAVDALKQIRGVTFKWDQSKQQNANQEKQFGVIAQDCLKVDPEICTLTFVGDDPDSQEEYYTLDYTNLTPYFIEAIKEQQATIESQQTMIESQQATINDLVSRLSALEAKVG